MKNILDVFAEKTGLEAEKDFVYTQEGGTGYCSLTVFVNGGFLKLGEFLYEEWIRNRSNFLPKTHYQDLLSVFCDECIERMNNPSLPMPKTLYGNHHMIIRDWKDKVDFPEWMVNSTENYFDLL